MATSVIYDLIDTLYSRFAAALPSTNVYDGYGVTDDPGDFLMIGVEDPNSDQSGTSAEGQQSWAGIGEGRRYEEGVVTCVALSWNGDGDQALARATVKAITDAVEADLRSDPNLGGAVDGLQWTGYGTRTQFIQDQDGHGAAAVAVFEIAFKARI